MRRKIGSRLAWSSHGWVTVLARQAATGGFRRSLVAWPASEHRKGAMSLTMSLSSAAVCRLIAGYFGAITKAYLLVSARKP
ncbi:MULTISPECIES: hypothetical protein [Mesorhizobium]|uniref:hypothetical protein n=1 Tax=Mesorhizobium TaxID=68287 RepID=UPI0015F2AE66|nr:MULTISPECIES: hypothetical protein [Mesorhizobium]